MGTNKKKYREKVVRIRLEDAEWFEENYPMYGAWSWLIQTTLSNFRALHEDTPTTLLDEAAKASVVQKASEARE